MPRSFERWLAGEVVAQRRQFRETSAATYTYHFTAWLKFLQAKRIGAAFMPYRYICHRIANELLHPWVHGYRRGVFWQYWWHMVDVEPRRGGVRA